MNAKLFINYRREDTRHAAGRLYDRLIQRFGEEQVFMDIDQIEPGEDFVEVINRKVGACDVAIVAIGPHWLGAIDESGKRRLDDEEDFVRMEIVAALQRKIRVIPVLVDGARMPRKQDLPEAIAPLSRRNAIELSETRFHLDVNRLIAAIEKSFSGAEKEVDLPATAQPYSGSQRRQEDSIATAKEPTTAGKLIQTPTTIQFPSTSWIAALKESKVWTNPRPIIVATLLLFLLALAGFLIWPRHQKQVKQDSQPRILTRNAPTFTPSAAAFTPSAPTFTPSAATSTRSAPTFTLNAPTFTPSAATSTRSAPRFTLNAPTFTPNALAFTPSSKDVSGNQDGPIMGISYVKTTEIPDAKAETNLTLEIAIKKQPGAVIDHNKVKILAFLYDIVDGKDIKLTNADVSNEWLTPKHDWSDTNPEVLRVSYVRPKTGGSGLSDSPLSEAVRQFLQSQKARSFKNSAGTGQREYLGYIVRVYYENDLQAVQAEPARLLQQFPLSDSPSPR